MSSSPWAGRVIYMMLYLSSHIACVGMPGGFKPQFFPNLQGIMRLFSRPVTAASLVVHLLSINLFAARLLYLAGAHDAAQPHHAHALPFWTEPGSRGALCMQVFAMAFPPGSASSCAPLLGPWGC